LDRRVRPDRILDVLREIDADIVALQEVLSISNGTRHDDQAGFFAEELGFHSVFGHNCELRGGRYGNLLLTRLPIHTSRNYDISFPARQPRSCLRADLKLRNNVLHIFNLHLGTSYRERRHQTNYFLEDSILEPADIQGPRIVLGDFNEWIRGAMSRMLNSNFTSPDLRRHLNRSRTYPGVLPFLHLDHIYFDPVLQLQGLTLFRNRTSLIASDHLPLVADFQIELSRS
jgi:endonuclease/exonuclease/phosphatase family metal-dependent hydrolase